MLACCLAWVLSFSALVHPLHTDQRIVSYSHRLHIPRVLFFSVKLFKKPRLIVKGLFALSDWPLPYPLPPDLFAYWSIGEADIAADMILSRKGAEPSMEKATLVSV